MRRWAPTCAQNTAGTRRAGGDSDGAHIVATRCRERGSIQRTRDQRAVGARVSSARTRFPRVVATGKYAGSSSHGSTSSSANEGASMVATPAPACCGSPAVDRGGRNFRHDRPVGGQRQVASMPASGICPRKRAPIKPRSIAPLLFRQVATEVLGIRLRRRTPLLVETR